MAAPENSSVADRDGATQRRFAEALRLFQAREAAAAEQQLRLILDQAADHAPSLNLLALIAGRDGRDAECVALLERAIAHGSGEQAAASAVLLGAAHERAGRAEPAKEAYRRAVAAAPGSADAALRLGLLLYRQARHAAAAEALALAITAQPGLAAAHGALAAVRNAEGRFAEAEALARRALALGEDAAFLNTLGVSLQQQDRLGEAAAAFEHATTLRPDFVDALYNLGMVRKDQARPEEAVALLDKVVALAPDLAAARVALCMAHLPPFYADEAEIERRRAAYAKALSVLADHADTVGAAALAPGVGAAQPFYLAYQGRDDVELQRRYGTLVCRAMAAAFEPAPLAAAPLAGERIRVGVVCGQIRDHSVWRLPTRGWIQGLDRSRFELIGYYTGAERDAETDRAEALFDRFVQGPLPFEAWRARIIEDRPHALIYPEVGMDPMVARLAALRLAPVQYASWGHPSTTGYPTLDYFLSSAAMEPEDADGAYGERLVRLPGLSTPVSLRPFDGAVPDRARLGLPAGATAYWCGQSLYKYLPQHDGVFAAIAARAPAARFLFVEFPGDAQLTERFRERLARAFAARGLEAGDHCLWLPRMSPEAYLAAMGCADVVLDSIGWSGCNSLIDALAHRLPIVTLPGTSLRSRHGAAILGLLGLEHLVRPTVAAFVETAVSLADPAARAAVKRALEPNLHRLADTSAIPALERHIADAVAAPVAQA